MLVKFLSFIASFLSNARYKAVLIPCIVVVLSITSLTAVALVHDSGSRSATSTAGQPESATGASQSPLAPQVGSGSKDTKDDTQQPIAGEPTTNKPTDGNTGSAPHLSASPPSGSTDVVLSTTTATVESNNMTRTITAAASDGNPLTWKITPENDDMDAPVVVTEGREPAATTFNFSFRALPGTVPGQYRYTLTAKDAARAVDISKVIVVTVNP